MQLALRDGEVEAVDGGLLLGVTRASAAITVRRSAPKNPFGFASTSTMPATSRASSRIGTHASDCTPSSQT